MAEWPTPRHPPRVTTGGLPLAPLKGPTGLTNRDLRAGKSFFSDGEIGSRGRSPVRSSSSFGFQEEPVQLTQHIYVQPSMSEAEIANIVAAKIGHKLRGL